MVGTDVAVETLRGGVDGVGWGGVVGHLAYSLQVGLCKRCPSPGETEDSGCSVCRDRLPGFPVFITDADFLPESLLLQFLPISQ